MKIAGWSSLVARRAHNPKVVGSNPSPATLTQKIIRMDGLFVLIENLHLALYNLH